MAEEAKSREVFQKINDIQVRLQLFMRLFTNLTLYIKLFFFVAKIKKWKSKNELELLRNERKEFESYIHKLENECQVVFASLLVFLFKEILF